MKIAITLLLAALPTTALAWPASTDWEPLTMGGSAMTDPELDAYQLSGIVIEDCWDIVGDSSAPAASWYVDESYLYLRMLLSADPLWCLAFYGGQWGFLLETDGDTSTFEHMIVSTDDSTDPHLYANTDGGTGLREEAEDLIATASSAKTAQFGLETSTSGIGDLDDYALLLAWSTPDLFDRGVLDPAGAFQLTAATSKSSGGAGELDHDGAGASSSGPVGSLASHLSDAVYIDEDSDDLYYFAELDAGTDPSDADTDNDGLEDGAELATYGSDPLDDDSDDDGLLDGIDADWCGDPMLADTDGDGLSDYDEYYVWSTSLCSTDSDNDGLEDGDEVTLYGTDPAQDDTDGDSLLDGDEVWTHGTTPPWPTATTTAWTTTRSSSST